MAVMETVCEGTEKVHDDETREMGSAAGMMLGTESGDGMVQEMESVDGMLQEMVSVDDVV